MKIFRARYRQILEDSDPKKSWPQIVKELVSLSLKNKKLPTFYIKKLMYTKDSGNYLDFLTPKEEGTINASPKLHRLEFTSLLKNKLASSLFFERCKLPIPKLMSYNVENLFFKDGKFKKIESISDLMHFFKDLMHTTGKKSLFLKHHGEMGGVGCFLLKESHLEQTLMEIGQNLLNGSFIHQETVVQHPEIDRIYSHSLNTVRFETYLNPQGEKKIRTCYIRFGNNGSIVDNGAAGGIAVPVSIESGQLAETGYKKARGLQKKVKYVKHPESDILFKDFTVPYFEEAKNLAFQCLKFVPDGYIGWDIAITQNGPILIEGNGSPVLSELQYGFKESLIGKEIINEIYS